MMDITLHVDIPALDRLAKAMELYTAVQKAAAESLTERSEPQPEPKPEPQPEPKPEPAPEPAPEPKPAQAYYTLDQVQRAAAQLRDQGRLKAVTDLFPEYGIKKLSDLDGDKLQAFAERLVGLGATL